MDVQDKSFGLVQETCKLLITLSTGFIAFTVTFSKELGGFELETAWAVFTWGATWITMIISIGAGVWVLLGITTELVPRVYDTNHVPTIRSKRVSAPFSVQILTFAAGVFFMVLYGFGRIFC